MDLNIKNHQAKDKRSALKDLAGDNQDMYRGNRSRAGDINIGDMDLDGLEVFFSNKIPAQIPPPQVSLLEKVIIQAKNMKFLGVVFK